LTTTRFYAVDAEGRQWTLAATSVEEAFTEVEGTYHLRKITKRIDLVTTSTVWTFDHA